MNKKNMNGQAVTTAIPQKGAASGLEELRSIVEDADENTIIRVIFTEEEPDGRNAAEKSG